MLRALLLCTLTLCVAALTQAAQRKSMPKAAPPLPKDDKITGRIFDPSKGFEEAAFLYENVKRKEGNSLLSLTTYRDLKGTALVEETTLYQDGKLQRYTYHQRQVNESGEVELKDGKVTYKFRTAHKLAEDSESIEPNMIVPDMVPGVVQENWDALMKGESVKTRFLVLERQDSFGFKFFRDKERQINGVPVVDFILKPSSFIIAAVAPQIRITAEKAPPHRTVEMDGILPVRVPEKFPPVKRSDYHALEGLLRFN